MSFSIQMLKFESNKLLPLLKVPHSSSSELSGNSKTSVSVGRQYSLKVILSYDVSSKDFYFFEASDNYLNNNINNNYSK